MFKSTTDLKKKRNATPTHHQNCSAEKAEALLKNKSDLIDENLIVSNSIATQTSSKENFQCAKGYSGLNNLLKFKCLLKCSKFMP